MKLFSHREKMMWILLPFILTSFVWGTVVLKMTKTHQTEEDDDISIRWDTDNKTDLSLINLVCFLSEGLKCLFYMMNGVEVPESQHQQFAGRVQLDKDALRDGRVTLHLSRVTAEDSGSYRCDLAADYDQVKRRWTLMASEHFVLNVTQNKDGEDSDVTHKAVTEGADHPPGSGQQLPSYQIIPLLLLVCVGVVTLWISWRCLKQPERKDQHGRYIKVSIDVNNEEDLFTM